MSPSRSRMAQPGCARLDHLLVHRWGLFIVESKSVTEEVRVRSDGSGGDEWSRVYRGKEVGMPSPIQQAQRQSEFLRAFLQRHREGVLGRQPVGLRTISKLVAGTDQRGFTSTPIQLVIAVSDNGKIRRRGGWKEPREPFRVFVTKADLVADKIRQELDRHRKAPTVVGATPARDYGMWSMKAQEVELVAEFLAARPRGASGRFASPAQADCSQPQPQSHPMTRPTAPDTRRNRPASIAGRKPSQRDRASTATTGGATRVNRTRRCP